MLGLLQNAFLFPGAYARFSLHAPPAGARSVWLDRPGGARVEAFWFAPADRSAPQPAFLILHGNFMPIDHYVEAARIYARLGFGALLVEYRGYGRSTGAPNPGNVIGDVVAFYDWLAAQPDVDPLRIGVHGYSIGGAVAGQILMQRAVRALVLVSTFSTVRRMLADKGVPPAMVRDDFRTVSALARYHEPVLVVHGLADRLIGPAHGRALAEAAPDGRFVGIENAGHDDVPFAALAAAIEPFLRATGAFGALAAAA